MYAYYNTCMGTQRYVNIMCHPCALAWLGNVAAIQHIQFGVLHCIWTWALWTMVKNKCGCACNLCICMHAHAGILRMHIEVHAYACIRRMHAHRHRACICKLCIHIYIRACVCVCAAYIYWMHVHAVGACMHFSHAHLRIVCMHAWMHIKHARECYIHTRICIYRRSNPWIAVNILLDLGRIWFAVSCAGFRHSPFATNSDQISMFSIPVLVALTIPSISITTPRTALQQVLLGRPNPAPPPCNKYYLGGQTTLPTRLTDQLTCPDRLQWPNSATVLHTHHTTISSRLPWLRPGGCVWASLRLWLFSRQT